MSVYRRRRGKPLGIRPAFFFDGTARTLDEAAAAGPPLTFSRASIATYFDSSGTLRTAASGVARLGAHYYNGSAWVNGGYLAEGARTNIILQSEAFDDAVWNKQANTTITANDETAPTGVASADLMSVSSNANNGISDAYTITASTDYATTIYFRKNASAPHAWFRILFYDGGSNQVRMWFNVVTGAIGGSSAGGTATLTAARVHDEGGTWYRAELVGQLAGTTAIVEVKAVDGDNSSLTTSVSGAEVHLWGAQLEQGSFMSSYIPTTTAAVARAQDQLTADLSSLSFTLPHSHYLEYRIGLKTVANTGILQLDDGSNNNYVIRHQVNGATVTRTSVRDSPAGEQTVTDHTTAAETAYKFACRIADGDQASSINGSAVQTNTVAGSNIPDDEVNSVIYGDLRSGAFEFYGLIKTHKMYLGLGKTNAELISVTG